MRKPWAATGGSEGPCGRSGRSTGSPRAGSRDFRRGTCAAIEGGAFPKVTTLRLLARAHGLDLEGYLHEVARAAERLGARGSGPGVE